jgi:hypothetical protein
MILKPQAIIGGSRLKSLSAHTAGQAGFIFLKMNLNLIPGGH